MGIKRKKSMNENGPKLIIVESPAKIKTISKFLGRDFKIVSTFGHIKDLPERRLGIFRNEKDSSIDVEYVVMPDKSAIISDICKNARECSEVFLASDPDREGEIIAWHIGQEIMKVFADDNKIYRITFNEITKPAIVEAIGNKTHIDANKVQAQQARRIMDRWVGYEVSPILWKKISKGLSAGRVQSVALLLICQREEDILRFKPEESWSVHGTFSFNSYEIIASLIKINDKALKLSNQEETTLVIKELKQESFIVTKIAEKKRSKSPLPPFMTSTLQQDAFNKLGFAVSKTMSIAQKLYEGLPLQDKNQAEALITYMRTDSLRISQIALDGARKFIEKSYGKEYLPPHANVYEKKGAQDAHEAIRPVNIDLTPDFVSKYLSQDETKLYELIWKRFVASQMKPAEYFLKQVTIEGGKFMFRATGSTLIFDGFLKVYLVEEDNEEESVKIPKEIKEQDKLNLKKLDPKQHFTQPPARYTEATLVKELEKRGIGRPSTYAAILSTIQKRGYTSKEVKRFVPTELGKAVTNMLVKNLPDIINVSFTALMEEDLDKIEKGEIKRDSVLNTFYEKFSEDLEAFGEQEKGKIALKIDLACPKCKSSLLIRFGKGGEFAGCSKFPECKFTSNFTRDAQGKITLENTNGTQELSLKCPQCSKTLVKKMGRFGPFIACPGYPECKYIHQETLKVPCPSCGSKLVKRRWRGGNFWGCAKYPECKFAIFGEVAEIKCPNCKSPYLLVSKNKSGEIVHTCPNKECGYKENIVSDA